MSQHGVCLATRPSFPPASSVRPLRVLTLTPFYRSVESPHEGGFIAEVLCASECMGMSNQVIAVRPFYRRRAQATDSDIPCVWKRYPAVPGNSGLFSAGKLLASTLAEIVRDCHRERSIDLIHAHAALPCGDAADRISEKLNIPFVVSVHGLDVFSERQAGKILGPWCRTVSKRVYRKARAVICISEKVRQRIDDPQANATVVYNGVDPSLFSPGTEQKSPLVVLSVGNLIPIKGHALLLRAFAELLQYVPDCVLEIIGDGPARKNLARLSESLGISDRVKLLGNQTREGVARAMKRCAVFALPSSYEALGCVYLEAMSSAKAVIGCEGQGIDEIVEHGSNGLLVKPGVLSQLSDALGMLLQNEEFRHRIGSAARDTILRRHTLAHQASQLLELYRGCL